MTNSAAPTLALLCAGAAKGFVEALAERFRAEHGATIAGTFGAVGAMKERLLAGTHCDAILLTQALLETLADDGRVRRDTIAPLGRVYTGVAVRTGDPLPAIDSADAMRVSLLAATSLHFPDPERATAGIHFMGVLERLGIRGTVAAKFRPYPNGATAMAELARASDARPLGCTQVTEILYTPSVTLAGKLPKAFELATLYSAAVCSAASDAALAGRFVVMVTGRTSEELRKSGGFE